MEAIFYLIDQKYETGQSVPVTGGQAMLSCRMRAERALECGGTTPLWTVPTGAE